MKLLVLLLATLALLASPLAAASTDTLPRYKLKPGMTLKQTIAKANRALNRSPGFSGADCWLYDGNARLGWRHAACVGGVQRSRHDFSFQAYSDAGLMLARETRFRDPQRKARGFNREMDTRAPRLRAMSALSQAATRDEGGVGLGAWTRAILSG